MVRIPVEDKIPPIDKDINREETHLRNLKAVYESDKKI